MTDAADVVVEVPSGKNGTTPAYAMPKVQSEADLGYGTPVVFKDLTYTVTSSKHRKEKISLLKNITGCFSPREMSALMGASGSGKTTLLDTISGRKTQGDISGEVLFSAQKPSQSFLRRYTGYVEQFDTLLDILTVREMLLYTAEMKRPMEEPLAEKERVVDHYIDVLGLEVCKDTRIGNPLSRGISGGQAKRANIAIAMVVDPRVLFLDEPTSGLDSYTSNEVMSVVKGLIKTGVTICATIHSPSPFCFSLFDRLMVLARGEVAYHGPNGPEMVEYFKHGCGISPPHTALDNEDIRNEADFLTDLVVGADREGRSGEYAQAYAKSDLKVKMDAIADKNAKRDTMRLTEAEQSQLSVKRATTTPLWKGLLTLVKYRTTRNYRNPEFLGPRIGDKFIFSILVATLYLGIGDDLVGTNYLNISAVLFMWSTLPAFGAASYVPALTLEKPLYVRERNDGLYRPITYLLAKIFDEILITVVSSLVFSAFVFYVVKLEGEFILFWLTYLVTLSTGIVLAYVVATLAPNMDVANAALPTYVVTLLFFGGFLFRFEDMPQYWKWYSYINFLRYAWGAQMMNSFRGVKDGNGQVPMIAGEPVLEYFGFDDQTAWGYLGYECLFFVAFFLAAWAALQFKRISKR
eukprot:jgi/Ulvmu1/3643/UM017_0057.1